MSSDYKGLLHTIEVDEKDSVRKILKETSKSGKTYLLYGKNLLDLAASGSQSEVMALLIEHGINQWVGSPHNNRIFIRLIEDYLQDRMFGNSLQNDSCCNKRSLKQIENLPLKHMNTERM
jgi:hypothetical protein